MNSIIVGTAGHIDHGKTALVKALTGHDTDTLAEEKKRGISINLGFTGMKLSNDIELGIVDMPGHEKFIKNMLAGAAGIDVAMIIIAANEGIMPQTREHIDILRYLAIQNAVIVLTKIDLVDEEFKELVIEDIKSYVHGTFLEKVNIIEVDSISKRGIEDLINELNALASCVKNHSFTKKPRMNIDRVFSIKGYGTVVTGTLLEGMIKLEDELVVYPNALPTKVRNLQVHDQNVDCAYAGQRTAINLSNVTVNDIKRGNTVAAKDGVYVTNILDVSFSIIKDTSIKMGKFYQLKLYVGASEEVGKFVPLTHRKVEAGDEGYAQILLDHHIALRKGDRFVLRTITPVMTIGGGVVVDPKPIRYKKITEELIKSIQAKDSASIPEMIEEYIKNNPFTTDDAISAFLNEEVSGEEQKELLENGQVITLDGQYVHIEYMAYFQYTVESHLKQYHQENTLRKGMPKAQLYEKLQITDKKMYEKLLWYLTQNQTVKSEQNVVSLFDFSPSLSTSQQKFKTEIEQKVKNNGYQLLTTKELAENNKEKNKVLELLIQNEYILISKQYVMHSELYEEAKNTIHKLYAEKETIKLSDFRDAIGASRKYALMILEKFDQEKFTIRKGEDRILNDKRK